MTDSPRTVPATKYHGTGNDFLVVDAAEAVPDRGAFAVRYCDRETGVASEGSGRTGADGVLFLDVDGGTDGTASDEQEETVRAEMTLVQPDASVAAMCGNGARCAAAWVSERTGARVVELETPAGLRRAVVGDRQDGEIETGDDEHETAGAVDVEVEMDRPSFAPAAVPLAADRTEPLVAESVEGLAVTAVDTGVPHAVAFLDPAELEAVDLEAVAPPVRHASVFPEGANVTLAARTGEGTFAQRTFERGVEGETRACGTGAVAVAAAARRLGLTDHSDVVVSPPGGSLRVRVPADAPATLAGPAEREFETRLAVPEARPGANAGVAGEDRR